MQHHAGTCKPLTRSPWRPPLPAVGICCGVGKACGRERTMVNGDTTACYANFCPGPIL
jgi:hypothetical protein